MKRSPTGSKAGVKLRSDRPLMVVRKKGLGGGRGGGSPAGQTAAPVDLGGGVSLPEEQPRHGHQNIHQGCIGVRMVSLFGALKC